MNIQDKETTLKDILKFLEDNNITKTNMEDNKDKVEQYLKDRHLGISQYIPGVYKVVLFDDNGDKQSIGRLVYYNGKNGGWGFKTSEITMEDKLTEANSLRDFANGFNFNAFANYMKQEITKIYPKAIFETEYKNGSSYLRVYLDKDLLIKFSIIAFMNTDDEGNLTDGGIGVSYPGSSYFSDEDIQTIQDKWTGNAHTAFFGINELDNALEMIEFICTHFIEEDTDVKTESVIKELSDNIDITEVNKEIPDELNKVSKDDKDYEQFLTLYTPLINDKFKEEYGDIEDKELWSDLAKEMFLKSKYYVLKGDEVKPEKVEESKKLNEDHQLYYDDIQYMSKAERQQLWQEEHLKPYTSEDEFWDWAEEEFPMKEVEESKKLNETKQEKLKYQGYTFIPVGNIKSNLNVNDYIRKNDTLNRKFDTDDGSYNYEEFYKIMPSIDIFKMPELDNILVMPGSNFLFEFTGDDSTIAPVGEVPSDEELRTEDKLGYIGTEEDKEIVDDFLDDDKDYMDISSKYGYRFNDYQLYNIATLYDKVDNTIKTKIEDVLDNINYRSECSDISANASAFKSGLFESKKLNEDLGSEEYIIYRERPNNKPLYVNSYDTETENIDFAIKFPTREEAESYRKDLDVKDISKYKVGLKENKKMTEDVNQDYKVIKVDGMTDAWKVVKYKNKYYQLSNSEFETFKKDPDAFLANIMIDSYRTLQSLIDASQNDSILKSVTYKESKNINDEIDDILTDFDNQYNISDYPKEVQNLYHRLYGILMNKSLKTENKKMTESTPTQDKLESTVNEILSKLNFATNLVQDMLLKNDSAKLKGFLNVLEDCSVNLSHGVSETLHPDRYNEGYVSIKTELYDPIESKLPDLARDVQEFLYDFDTYDYNDNYMDDEEAFEDVMQTLVSPIGRQQVKDRLKDVIEEDNIQEIKDKAQELINRIDEFDKELKTESQVSNYTIKELSKVINDKGNDFKLQIVGSEDKTNWLNIDKEDLKRIYRILQSK